MDHLRRQCGPGRGLRRARGGRTLHSRRDRDGAHFETRAHAGARREARARLLRRRLEDARGARLSGRRGHLHPSLRRPRFHRRPWHDGPRDPRGLATDRGGRRQRRRRRTARRCRQRGQGLEAHIKLYASEPETAAPLALSLEKGSPQKFEAWKPSFVDGAGGQSVFPRMWERMRPLVDGSIVASLADTQKAMRLVAEKTRVIAEGAGALAVAAAISGKAGQGPVVAIVSGGNIDLKKFCELVAVTATP
ncbi:MAG: pyridoxal-phosphate dependent enzyme [Planctomycetes bacterium]|nr:pyridoxal-phosphate dependent enzyme [Planctomycetota bacterium]